MIQFKLKRCSLSRKLKKRILETCGLSNLGREARHLLAKEIYESNDLKQQICNEIDGVSFRDIEKVLSEFIVAKRTKNKDSRKTETNTEPDRPVQVENKRTVTKLKLQPILNRNEVNELLAASELKEWENAPVKTYEPHETYSIEETLELLNNSGAK